MDMELMTSVFVLMPFPVFLLVSGGVLLLALSRTLGWIRYAVPLGWAIWSLLFSVPVFVKGELAAEPLLILVAGLIPMLGWFRRYRKGDIRHPFPLDELPLAVLNPDALRVIRTADVFMHQPPEE